MAAGAEEVATTEEDAGWEVTVPTEEEVVVAAGAEEVGATEEDAGWEVTVPTEEEEVTPVQIPKPIWHPCARSQCQTEVPHHPH